MNAIIRKANKEDASKIYKIVQDNTLMRNKETSRNGFLVSNFSLNDYEDYISVNQHFYVIEESREVKAFLLAFTEKELDYNLCVNKYIKKVSNNSFIVIKQICVGKNEHNQGYGSRLYEYLMDVVEEDMYTAIVQEPYNNSSVKFHTKHGFNWIHTITSEDGLKRGIFYWVNPHNNVPYDKDIILSQYQRAIELYSHEDNLNWSKINHFFYMTGGLLAVLSFISSFKTNMFSFILSLVSLVGALASYIFYVAIKSGIEYMQERKKSVIFIEKVLICMKGVSLVTTCSGPNNKSLMSSQTTKVMKAIPIVCIFIWLCVFIFNTVSLLLSYIG